MTDLVVLSIGIGGWFTVTLLTFSWLMDNATYGEVLKMKTFTRMYTKVAPGYLTVWTLVGVVVLFVGLCINWNLLLTAAYFFGSFAAITLLAVFNPIFLLIGNVIAAYKKLNTFFQSKVDAISNSFNKEDS